MNVPEPLTPEYARAVREGMEIDCPVQGCPNQRRISHAMCRRCWPLVPRDVQHRVYRTWGQRVRFRDARSTEAHEAAIDAAVAIASKHLAERQRPGQAALDL